MKAITATILLLSSLYLPMVSQAQSDEEILHQAHALFHQASDETDPQRARELYSQALLRYEQVHRSQPHPRLAYNIGNTYYRLGDMGRALVNYRRAAEEMATDDNLLHNLELIRSQRRDQAMTEAEPVSLLNLHHSLALDIRIRILLGLYAAFWLTGTLFYLKRKLMPVWIPATLLLLCLLASTSVGLETLQPLPREGIIVADEIVARQGDGRNYQPAFAAPLYSATEFTLLKKQGHWLQIKLLDGRTGWIPARTAELI